MIGIIIGILASFFIALYFYKKSASKKDVEKVKIEVEKTREKIQSFIDGFAENTPENEPLKGKIKKADSLYHEKRYKEAYNLYDETNKKALSEGKEKIFALSLMGKGISIGILGDYQQAIRTLNNTKDYKDFLDNSAKAKLYFNLGYCNQMLKNNDIAIEYYGKSVNVFPDVANVYNNRGNVYTEIGEYKQAIKDYDKAIELNPEFTEAYSNRGNAYINIGEYKRAIQDYDKAIELDPEYAGAYSNRGNAYRIIGNYERSIPDLTKAIELEPKYAGAYFNKALTCDKAKKNKEAIKSYKKFLDLTSKNDKKQIAHAKERIKELQKEMDKNNQ